ncbi:uncharacterized protein [Oscarella lobularis]|uniref:uncharacterized protein n=1 Tax=Oscarella lobularis TaxID=121494 RepID=UPI0033139A1E
MTGLTLALLALASGFLPHAESWWWGRGQSPPRSYSCPSLRDPPNGHVQLGYGSSGGYYGCRTAYYVCDDGYALHGSSHRACCHGQWNGAQVKCLQDGQWGGWTEWTACSRTCDSGTQQRTRKCDSPPPEPEARDCQGADIEKSDCFVEPCSECDVTELRGPVRVHLGHKGDTAYLSCPNGFVPSGNQVRTCDSTSKTWDEELFTALPCRQRCHPLDAPGNGSVRFDDASGAVYFCNEGFRLVGSDERRCVDGRWTEVEPICIPTSIPMGDLVGIHPVLSFEMGGHAVNSPVFIMGAANDKPALRSVFFYYRTLNRRSRGVVSLRVQLLRVFDGGQTRPVEKPISLRLQPSAAPEILTPVCIQLSSRQPEFFRSRIELKFTVPDSNTFEIRRLDTSQTDVCITKEGECPSAYYVQTEQCGAYCRHDGSCPDEMKCCSTSCGLECVRPLGRFSKGSKGGEPAIVPPPLNCSDDGSSGDCGFKNSPCGSQRWSLVTGDPRQPDDTFELPPAVSPGDRCIVDVCVECLYRNSIFDTTRMKMPAGPTGAPGPIRCKRDEQCPTAPILPTYITGNSKAFCFEPNSRVPFVFGTMDSDVVSSQSYDKVSFSVSMYTDGTNNAKHHITVSLRCKFNDDFHISLGDRVRKGFYTEYHVPPNFDGEGLSDEPFEIPDINRKIREQFSNHGMCTQYVIKFRVVAELLPACVTSITFTGK